MANLRFPNIDWENDVIRLIQKKTGNPIELPLLEDVGGAIINYLKNARPKTESDFVFVMPVLCEASHKVGKTTTATTLSYLLSQEGCKVALIDFDGQSHSTKLNGNGADVWNRVSESG